MKLIASIFLLTFSLVASDTTHTDVNHMIVKFDGETLIGSIDSINRKNVYFIQKDSAEYDSLLLKDVYYIYNDYDRIFYKSWSFEQNLNRMKNRSGFIFTLNGDTIPFYSINFIADMIHPEIFIKTGLNQSEFISLFEIQKIVTDNSIMQYSIERGFFYSFYAFLVSATLDIPFKWDNSRRASPQIWDRYNDLLPKATMIGLNDTGSKYESLILSIPISVGSSMLYDLWKKKNVFYFTSAYEENLFGRNMYVFSLKHISKVYLENTIFKLENTKLGVKFIGWIRGKNS